MSGDRPLRTFSAGDRVICNMTGEPEYGVVVHSWWVDEIGDEDCYVAFFGATCPAPGVVPARVPYVLRYSAGALRLAPTST